MEYNKFGYDEYDDELYKSDTGSTGYYELGIGAAIIVYNELGIGTAIIERINRRKMLKGCEELIEIMSARLKYEEDIEKGVKATGKITIGKKEIDLRDYELDGTDEIATLILNNMEPKKMNKKEFKKWVTQINELIKITDQVAARSESKAKEQL